MKKRSSYTLIELLTLVAICVVSMGLLVCIITDIRNKRAVVITKKILDGHAIGNEDMVFYRANRRSLFYTIKTGESVLADIAEFDAIPAKRIEIFTIGMAKTIPFAEVFCVATSEDYELDIETRKLVIHQGWTSDGIPFKNLLVNNYSYCQPEYVDSTTPTK